MSKLLLIDAGNSRVKWFTGSNLEALLSDRPIFSAEVTIVKKGPKGGRKILSKKKFPDGWGEMETAKVTAAGIRILAKDFPEQRVVLSSVVPKLIPYFERAFRGRIHVVRAPSPLLGLKFHYPKPEQLGADRLAAAAAIREEGIYPAIIVQCGTATAFSVLDAEGRFCGGAIAPGPQAQLRALVGSTAQLPEIPLTSSPRALGRSTEDAIRSGVMHGFRGGVSEILKGLCEYFPGTMPWIVLTGGNAYLLESQLEYPVTLRPLLVFEGLRIIGARVFKT